MGNIKKAVECEEKPLLEPVVNILRRVIEFGRDVKPTYDSVSATQPLGPTSAPTGYPTFVLDEEWDPVLLSQTRNQYGPMWELRGKAQDYPSQPPVATILHRDTVIDWINADETMENTKRILLMIGFAGTFEKCCNLAHNEQNTHRNARLNATRRN